MDATNPAPEPTLTDAVRELKKALKRAVGPARRLEKALDRLLTAQPSRDLGALQHALDALEACPTEALGLSEPTTALRGQLEPLATGLRGRLRGELLSGLRREADANGSAWAILSERPLTLLMTPLTLRLDLEANSATFEYAREPVLEVTANLKAVATGHKKAIALIRDAAIPSDRWFCHLEAAYALALAARGRAPAERVDIVDLLGPLSLVATPIESWRLAALSHDKIETYPRYLLAYQLQRLRKDGLLTHRGRRVELGTATGGSTRQKRNVLFVPTTGTEGQYHLSLRISDAEEPA